MPKDIETIEGQDILAKDFNLGSFSILIVNDKMPTKDILKMEEKIKEIDCVDKVIGASDILGTTIPQDMLPDDIKDELNKQGTTPILVTFTSGMGEEDTINAITKIREIADSQCKVSGISAMATDIKYLLDSEMALYVVIAVVLCIIILELALDSFAVPVILLVGIGMAVLYNMGSNVMLGQISYLTKAVASVLQLGVTMDFSIFLYHSYQKEKESSKDIKFDVSEDKKISLITAKPKFINENKETKISNAEKGTLMHLCVQKMDEKQEYTLEKIQDMINTLKEKVLITEAEAETINKEKLLKYTKSELWQDLKQAKQIYKEQPFYINIKASTVYDNIEPENDENILVQGVIDLFYINKNDEIVLVDFKTDYIKEGEEDKLVKKYNKQLEIYKKALENSLNRKVDETYICLLNWGQSLIDSFGHFGTPLTKNSHKIYDKQ